jgi:hypothetical protein
VFGLAYDLLFRRLLTLKARTRLITEEIKPIKLNYKSIVFFVPLLSLVLLLSQSAVAQIPPDDCAAIVTNHKNNRETFIDEYATRIATSPMQNETWIQKAEKTNLETPTVFLVIENAALKQLNDRMKDKTLPTALTNLHQTFDMQEIDHVLLSYQNVSALPYSDYKSTRFAFQTKSKSKPLSDDFMLQLHAAYARSQNRYHYELETKKILRAEDGDPSKWYRGGTGSTADKASIAARVAFRIAGPNALVDFDDEKVQRYIEGRLSLIHNQQSELNVSLRGSPLLIETPNAPGLFALRTPIFEVYRKYPEAALFKEVLKRRFEYDAADDQIQLIRNYIQNANIFSPALHIRSREIASLSGSQYGGFSIDFVGIGGLNLSQTARALSVSTTIEQAIANVRANELALTREFNHKKQLVKDTIEFVLHRHNFKGTIRNSGDDMVFRPDQPLTAPLVEEIGHELIKAVTPSSLRIAFVLPNHMVRLPYDEFVAFGEDLEKRTRAELEGVVPLLKLENILLMVQVGADIRNLVLASKLNLSEKELDEINTAFTRVK